MPWVPGGDPRYQHACCEGNNDAEQALEGPFAVGFMGPLPTGENLLVTVDCGR